MLLTNSAVHLYIFGDKVSEDEKVLFSLPTRMAGMSIYNPVELGLLCIDHPELVHVI